MSVSLLKGRIAGRIPSCAGSPRDDGLLLRGLRELPVSPGAFSNEDTEETKMCIAAVNTVALRHEANPKG